MHLSIFIARVIDYTCIYVPLLIDRFINLGIQGNFHALADHYITRIAKLHLLSCVCVLFIVRFMKPINSTHFYVLIEHSIFTVGLCL